MMKATPKVPDDRSWSKQQWLAAHRACRVVSKIISRHEAMLSRKTDEAFTNLCLYGHCTIDIKPEDLL